jgi:hypothetical protein
LTECGNTLALNKDRLTLYKVVWLSTNVRLNGFNKLTTRPCVPVKLRPQVVIFIPSKVSSAHIVLIADLNTSLFINEQH